MSERMLYLRQVINLCVATFCFTAGMFHIVRGDTGWAMVDMGLFAINLICGLFPRISK